jgi:hypothetical protein
MIEFLDEMSREYPTMVLHVYDISEEENRKLYDLFNDVYGLNLKGHPIPIVFIGKDSFRGYGPPVTESIQKKLEGCFKESCTIALTEDKECIVIVDHTPTPEVTGVNYLLLFLMLAGVFCCVTPYNSEIVSQLRGSRSFFFFVSYFLTSLAFCFALSTVGIYLSKTISLELPTVAIAGLIGILSLISVKIKILRVPRVLHNAMNNLIADTGVFSLFSLGIGAFIISLMYNLGIYLLAAYSVSFFSIFDRLENLAVCNMVLVTGLVALYAVKPKKNTIFYGFVGAGSIGLAVFFWFWFL